MFEVYFTIYFVVNMSLVLCVAWGPPKPETNEDHDLEAVILQE